MPNKITRRTLNSVGSVEMDYYELSHLEVDCYHIYLKYWDTLIPYHTCPII